MFRRLASLTAASVLAGLALPTASAAPPPSERGGGHSTIVATHYAGKFRDALLYVAPGVPTLEPVPLVLVLHGLHNDAQTADAAAGFDLVADRERVAVLYPYGLNGSWNAGSCCGASAAMGVDDVGFLAHLVQLVSTVRPIDPTRVYITGFSNGGMMAMRAACERPDVFTAAASVAGTLQTECAGPGHLSALFLHGTGDATVPYDGLRYSKFLKTSLTAVPVAAGRVAKRDGCSNRSLTNTDQQRRIRYTGCLGGTTVEVQAFVGLGHTWPSKARNGIDGGQIVWDFLRRHSRTVQ